MLKTKTTIYLIIGTVFSLLGKNVFALEQTTPSPVPARDRLNSVSGNAGYIASSRAPQQIITSIILYILGFVGLIFLVMIVMAGIKWMTAGGNADQADKARSQIKNAVIGFAVVMIAYSITYFISNMLFTASS